MHTDEIDELFYLCGRLDVLVQDVKDVPEEDDLPVGLFMVTVAQAEVLSNLVAVLGSLEVLDDTKKGALFTWHRDIMAMLCERAPELSAMYDQYKGLIRLAGVAN